MSTLMGLVLLIASVLPGTQIAPTHATHPLTSPHTATASVATAPISAHTPQMPHDGCTVTVQPGQWLSEIAGANWQEVAVWNALANPNLIYPNERLSLCGAAQPAPASGVQYAVMQPATPQHLYPNIAPWGFCVWYALNQRPDIYVPPVPWAKDMAWAAANAGDATGSTPQINAIAIFQPGVDGAGFGGHAAIVRQIFGNGTILIQEMNGPSGFGIVDSRVVALGWGVSFIYN